MPIKPARTVEIRALIAALASDDDVQRESAVARLAMIGGRAVHRLAAAYAAAPRDMRVAVLRALEAIADPRGVAVARGALGEGGDVAVAAAAALRPLLQSRDSRTATAALDALVEASLNPSAERRVRLAAFDALREMPASVRNRVAAALRQDPGGEALAHPPGAAEDAAAVWQAAVEGRLPDDPAGLQDPVQARGGTAPLGVLQKMIDAVRIREREAQSPARREAWRSVRGALHQALALRNSRVAVYDLRETLEAADAPLPATFMAALQAIGDESCLEATAAAWTAATARGGSTTTGQQIRFNPVQHGSITTVQHGSTRGDRESQAEWRHQLEAAFQAIVAREKISRRGAAWKRLQARYPDAVAAFSTTSRTRPRPKTRGRT